MGTQPFKEYRSNFPGFRFKPTEEELLGFYLRRETSETAIFRCDFIKTIDLYAHDPWELPRLANVRERERENAGEREWYFFVCKDKNMNKGRTNRIAKGGFWKATGTDRQIRGGVNRRLIMGMKKTLVYYTGKAPRGCKTDWIMNEFRMPENCPLKSEMHELNNYWSMDETYKDSILCFGVSEQKDIVLCKIYQKAMTLKVLEQQSLQHALFTKMNQQCDPGSESATAEHDQDGSCSMLFANHRDQHQETISLPGTNQYSMDMFTAGWIEPQLAEANLEWPYQHPIFSDYDPSMDVFSSANILIETSNSQNLCFEASPQWTLWD